MVFQGSLCCKLNMSRDYVEVKVEEGILRGEQKTSEGLSPIKYYAFKGIPFAKPPVGDLRFKAPQPADPWDGVKDALKERSGCIQTELVTGLISGEEDCLYLNIYTLELSPKSNILKPVLVSIHGGGFSGGSGGTEVICPDYFLEHDIVFVSPNYRVAALGFLSLQNDEISGNAGLKDQVQALLWIQKNIKQFGGDPENVTIMGLSAGAASVEFLLLTELTKGLFKQAIIQSGSALNSWSLDYNPRDLANKLAEKLGYTGNIQDNKSSEHFFKSCSAKTIIEKQNDVLSEKEKLLFLKFSFAPCVEKEGKGQKFITRTPRKILESGNFSHVPIIKGLTNNEGYFVVTKPLRNCFEKLNNNWELCIPINLDVPKDKQYEVAREIMQYFFDCKPISRNNVQALSHLNGDLVFNNGIGEATKYILQSSQKPVYCYGVSYETSTGMIKKVTPSLNSGINVNGVPHGGDVELLFKPKSPNIQPSPVDKTYIKIYTTLLTTFAKTGNPNYEGMEFPAWEPATSSVPQYLDIGNELKMKPGRLHEERLQFWNNLYTKYGYLY